jgi:hypothetical protein
MVELTLGLEIWSLGPGAFINPILFFPCKKDSWRDSTDCLSVLVVKCSCLHSTALLCQLPDKMPADSVMRFSAKRSRKTEWTRFAGKLQVVLQSRQRCCEANFNCPMGTIKQGILGGFRGRVGDVIGSTWKGQDVMKIRPASVFNPNTERQQLQRAKFGLVGRFNKAHLNLIRIGFRAYTKNMTAGNAAMSYNLSNAVTDTFPDLSIDFSKVMISMGTLAPVNEVSSVSEASASLTLNWTSNSNSGNGKDSDQVIVSLYDRQTAEVVYFPGCASRQEESVTIGLPANWSGRTAEVLVFLISLEGNGSSASRELVSNTVYAGSVEIM